MHPVPARLEAMAKVQAQADLFKILSAPLRLRIVLLLVERGELPNGKIAATVGESGPSVSHQLTILAASGVLDATPQGRWMVYSVAGGTRALVARLVEPFAQVVSPAVEPVATTAKATKTVKAKAPKAVKPQPVAV